MKKINVFKKKIKDYEIIIKYKLFKYIKDIKILNNKNKIMIITNEFLYKKYYKYFFEKLISININYKYYLIKDGEYSKSIKTVNDILTVLLNYSYDRNSILIAFGGGVIGDITGFVSSIYLRGIKYLQIPTTLLSQIDSSIGSKTGVNHALGKNMIGSFYSPSLVLTDIKFLYSLSKKELSSGIAEVIKYSIILDYDFFVWLENNIEKILRLEKNELKYCIYKCCLLKSKIINKDYNDNIGIRSILNFGHTYGHAIETFMGYGNWTHGEAISSGMIMATKLSCYINNFSEIFFNRIKNLFLKVNLPISGPNIMKSKDYIYYMIKDKKNSNNNINIVMPIKIGKALLMNNIPINMIIKSINDCKYNIKIK